MNKSQKNSLAALIMAMLLLVFCAAIPFAWFSETLIIRLSPLVFFVLIYLVMGLSVIFLRRKQNPAEVDYDERDTIIRQKAIFVSYITLWILVLIGCTLPVGLYYHGVLSEMTILVNMFPVALFLMFAIVLLIYSLTVLTQYGWRNKNE